MKKVLYIKHADSTFILSDQRILEKQYRIFSFLINQKNKGFHFIMRMANLCIFLILNASNSAAFVTWFGDYHSAVMVIIGKLLGKKTIIFVGGQEAICYPELQKGVYYKKWRGRFVKYALRNATLLIPNHSSLLFHENFYYTSDGKKDGIMYYVKGISTPVSIVPNGINTQKFYRDKSIGKETDKVLTVGTMNSNADFINKGFDLFLELAKNNPDLNFTLIGIKKPFLPWIEAHYPINNIPNLELIFSFCPDHVLFKEYNRAKVYVQASITEGMPNTLNEAMLCECIPVGSNVNGIPDAIGETGVIVEKRNLGSLENAVRKALTLNTGEEARQRVLQNFTFELREQRLLKILSDTIG